MASRKFHVGVFLIAAAVLSRAVLFGADDMRAGTWKLNIAKSKYSPGPPPKGPNTQKIEATANGYKMVTDGVNAQGQKTHDEYTLTLDGKDIRTNPMVDGKPAPNGPGTLSARKVNDSTIELTSKRDGKILVTITDTISKDGKTRTGTVNGTNAQGQKVSNSVVWEKQ
jgi:hypothetical protein